MADSIEKNIAAFEAEYPNEADDVILAWATMKYNEDFYNETIAYKDNRKREHATIGDQLDMLFKDIDAGLLGEDAKTGSWYLAVKEVKDNNPKPSE